MANKPITNPVADLPENWTNSQIVSANGTEAGLTAQHGYNHLMEKVNEALEDLGDVNDAFEGLLTTGDESSTKTSGPADVVAVTDAAAVDIAGLTAQIVPAQNLNGYSYPWPANGGINQWDEVWELGSLGSSGQNQSSTTAIRSKNYIPVSAETQYYFHIGYQPSGGIGMNIFFYNSSNTFIDRINGVDLNNAVFTTPANTAYIRFNLAATYGTSYRNDIAINYPASVTAYSPYENICPINIRNNVNGHNPATNTVGYYYDQNLVWKASANTTITDFIPCNASTAVSILLQSVQSNINLRINCFNAAKEIQSQLIATTVAGTTQYNVTLPQGTQYIRVSTNWASAPIWKILVSYTIWRNVDIYCTDGANLLAGKSWTDGAYYNDSGEVTASASLKRMASYIPVVGGEPYIFQCQNNDNGAASYCIRIHEYDSNQTWLRQIYSDYGELATWTASDDAAYIRMSLGKAATNIVCYRGSIHSIDWTDEAGTVYGGTLEYKGGGAWRLTKTMASVDSGALTWASNPKQATLPFTSKNATLAYSDTYKQNLTTSPLTLAANEFCIDNGGNRINVKTADGNDPTGTFILPLATPTTYDLTTEQVITMLQGANSISADCGPVTLTYKSEGLLTDADYTDLVQQIADKSIAYPLVSAPAWNTMQQVGSVTPAITLPEIGSPSTAQEFRYIFEAASANASFTAPTGVYLTDGSTKTAAGGTLAYTDLTIGSVYECSFAVLTSTLIAVVMKEWA